MPRLGTRLRDRLLLDTSKIGTKTRGGVERREMETRRVILLLAHLLQHSGRSHARTVLSYVSAFFVDRERVTYPSDITTSSVRPSKQRQSSPLRRDRPPTRPDVARVPSCPGLAEYEHQRRAENQISRVGRESTKREARRRTLSSSE